MVQFQVPFFQRALCNLYVTPCPLQTVNWTINVPSFVDSLHTSAYTWPLPVERSATQPLSHPFTYCVTASCFQVPRDSTFLRFCEVQLAYSWISFILPSVARHLQQRLCSRVVYLLGFQSLCSSLLIILSVDLPMHVFRPKEWLY